MTMHNKSNNGLRLDRRLFLSYIVVILIAITTSFTLFTISANQFFIYRIEEDMRAQLNVIAEDIKSNPVYVPTPNVISNNLLKMVHSDLIILRDGELRMSTNRALFDEISYYNEVGGNIEDRYIVVSDSVIIEPTERTSRVEYTIILLSEKEMITALNQVNLSILFITSLISMLIATFFGVYAQNTISKPILELKNKVNDFRQNLITPQPTIFTRDEIQELDENLFEMAEVIVKNDRKRKSFFENTSHELKTPLMSIRGYAEGLKDGIFSIDEAAEVILEESESLRTMDEAILYLSKLEDSAHDNYHLQEMEINEFLDGFYHKMSSLVNERGLEFKLELGEPVELKMDDDKMIRALSNVITNAVRYAENVISIQTYIKDDLLNIRIFNDGPQVSDEALTHLFDRFYKGDKGQSGLGLAILQSIITAHGGKVEALNVEGGFCMNIQLPYIKNK